MHVHHLNDSENNELSNLITLCVACHAVLHVGKSLMHGAVEIWKSEIPQDEIVKVTRDGVREGRTLDTIKKQLPLSLGTYPPESVEYANSLALKVLEEDKPRAYLDEPLCAVFIRMKRWQLESEIK